MSIWNIQCLHPPSPKHPPPAQNSNCPLPPQFKFKFLEITVIDSRDARAPGGCAIKLDDNADDVETVGGGAKGEGGWCYDRVTRYSSSANL